MLDFITWLVFAATGKVFIYLWMIFPFPPFMKMPYWLEKLHECDLCSGFWIYAALAISLEASFYPTNGLVANIIGELATAAVTTYLVHVFSIGWREKFSPPVIINEVK